MKALVITLAVLFALGLTALPAVVPALGPLDPTAGAEARKCIMGSDGDCIIPIYCFTDPCWSFP